MSLSEESLAAARARHQKNIRPCEGTCGRDTRSSKVPKHLFPETVLRGNGTHCATCWRDLQDADLKAHGKTPPARGGGTPRETSPEKLAKLKAEAEKFTAARRERLARAARQDLMARARYGPVRGRISA